MAERLGIPARGVRGSDDGHLLGGRLSSPRFRRPQGGERTNLPSAAAAREYERVGRLAEEGSKPCTGGCATTLTKREVGYFPTRSDPTAATDPGIAHDHREVLSTAAARGDRANGEDSRDGRSAGIRGTWRSGDTGGSAFFPGRSNSATAGPRHLTRGHPSLPICRCR